MQVMREQSSLLSKTKRREVGLRLKYHWRCCVTSKSALLIMCWNLFITILIAQWLDTSNYLLIPKVMDKTKIQKMTPAFLSFLAILYFFFPVAGYLADIRCGRYKTVTNSLWFIFWSALFLTVGAYVLFLTTIYLSKISAFNSPHHNAFIVTIILVVIGVGLPTLSAALLLLTSYVGFSANIIQFGMDQLLDSPSEDLALFVHWFVFTYNIGLALSQITWTTYDVRHDIYVLPIPVILTLAFLGVSLCIARHKHNWFFVDSGSRNPYKLVYKVIKFAAQHKNPICRSAFTYCEDELPSRMDLGKEKYGGPFTTEQVEDVKAFLGILRILITLGPIFTVEVAVSRILFIFPAHLKMSFEKQTPLFYLKHYIILGGFPNLFITILLPVYLCIFRPFIHHYIPGMLKRIGLGTILFLLSSICILLIDVLGHITSNNQVCFINITGPSDLEPQLSVSVWYLLLPYTLNAVGYMFLYTAIFEFICAQGPHAMKGLLVGILFTVEGIFQLIGIIILAPFTIWKFETSFPSCGFVYYFINILVALIGLVVYTCISRRYQYRQRDEPDNTYRYAEEYYDRDENEFESSYDYSNDHDHLNVHSLDYAQ